MSARISLLPLLCVLLLTGPVVSAENDNPLIDYDGFVKQAIAVGKLRENRRVSESDFIQMARAPATIVLDARSRERFAQLHVRGAQNLPLPDFTEAELAKIIPSKEVRVVIYCNNNFKNEPTAFATKAVTASLNVHTFNVLHSYGYTNVYELKPLLDRKTTKIPFEGTLAEKK